jgi:phospholipid transport system substrate-binding protein
MNRILAMVGAMLLALAASTSEAVAQRPEQVVQTTAEAVIARVTGERESLRSDPQRLHALVDSMIVPHFDFPRMAQWVLGRHWREVDAQSKSRFIQEFKNLLVRTYATALLEYSHQNIVYHPGTPDANAKSVIVRTELEQPGTAPVPIVYRMHEKDGDWKVFDVAVDGVSLITTYRASFAEEIKKGGIGGLIDNLASRNADHTPTKGE